jgi:hypothetical protein
VITADLFTRLGHLRDLPTLSYPPLDDNFVTRVQPESFIQKRERVARKKKEEEEEKENALSEEQPPSVPSWNQSRPHTDSY